MINIGNKEITSIYCGKNAVNGIYCGQTLIWPTTSKTRYLVSFQSEYEDASYDLENPYGGTPDHEFFQEVYESTSDDKIYIAKVVQEYDTDSYEILNWWYSADSRYIADDEIQVFVPVIAYGEMEDVGECWFRSEMFKTFDNQADADDYVNYIHQNGIDDFTDFEMSNAKDIVYNGTQPYAEFPYVRSVWPPSDPSVDTQNWITEGYDKLPKYNEHKEWLTGTITDSQGQDFSAVFTKGYDDENETDFNLTMLNGMKVGTSSPIYFSIYWTADADDKWQITFLRNEQYIGNYDANTTGRNTKNFNFTIDVGGMTMNFNLTRTDVDPTIQ